MKTIQKKFAIAFLTIGTALPLSCFAEVLPLRIPTPPTIRSISPMKVQAQFM